MPAPSPQPQSAAIHPGIHLRDCYLTYYGISVLRLSVMLDLKLSNVGRIVRGEGTITLDIARRLERVFSLPTAADWLCMMARYDAATKPVTGDHSRVVQFRRGGRQ